MGSKTPTAMNSMTGVSVCLAAEYLGKDAEQLAASLPINFIQEDQENDRKKKKKSKRFLPKVGVKELASRLEPQLFQDADVGGKMTISQDQASGMIYDAKKKTIINDLEERPK